MIIDQLKIEAVATVPPKALRGIHSVEAVRQGKEMVIVQPAAVS
ncbi:hypothetical protein [Methylobacterium durans]|nr:hypothetical protein [Methylobacterium durans]